MPEIANFIINKTCLFTFGRCRSSPCLSKYYTDICFSKFAQVTTFLWSNLGWTVLVSLQKYHKVFLQNECNLDILKNLGEVFTPNDPKNLKFVKNYNLHEIAFYEHRLFRGKICIKISFTFYLVKRAASWNCQLESCFVKLIALLLIYEFLGLYYFGMGYLFPHVV